ncbi:hypothetical protein [Thermoactinospora rubra]|uniref:hypothetical protein n=1 Tax=Thermoactinospora rubra TaxID=1088767 RepID=UPI000A103102|nr:hypothetical protein [Thermoactinospora rubra]
MRYRMVFAAGLAIGYVLGSRAGRERYEQIKRAAQRIADSPRVQEAAGVLGAQASKVADVTKSKMGSKLQRRLPFLNKEHDTGTGWPEQEDTPTDKVDKSGIPY